MDKVLFDKLKNFRGSIAEIARRTGLDQQSITYILRDGRWINHDVHSTAKNVLEERKQSLLASLNEA